MHDLADGSTASVTDAGAIAAARRSEIGRQRMSAPRGDTNSHVPPKPTTFWQKISPGRVSRT
jgi:hypothetical protein